MTYKIIFEGLPPIRVKAENYDDAYWQALAIAEEENCEIKDIKPPESSFKKITYLQKQTLLK